LDNRLKAAFGGIRAEDSLKADTMVFLRNELRARTRAEAGGRAQGRALEVSVGRFAAALAAVAAIALSALFAYNLYHTPSAYIDVDVNPSVELTLNRFDRVIGVRAYNEDGEDIVSGLSLKHKRYGDALIALIDAISRADRISDGGLVSITLQTNNYGKEAGMLATIQIDVSGYITGHGHRVQVEVFPVGEDTQSLAQENEISPAKYIAIQELMEVDSTATVDGCRGHTISEIRQRTQEHSGGHHGNGGGDNDVVNDNEPPDDGGKDDGNHDGGGKDDVSHDDGKKDDGNHDGGSKDDVSHDDGSKDDVSHDGTGRDDPADTPTDTDGDNQDPGQGDGHHGNGSGSGNGHHGGNHD
jgi:hypothetical protein